MNRTKVIIFIKSSWDILYSKHLYVIIYIMINVHKYFNCIKPYKNVYTVEYGNFYVAIGNIQV